MDLALNYSQRLICHKTQPTNPPKSQRILCVSFSVTDSGLCKYHLVVWSSFNLLYNSQWITFLTKLWLVVFVSFSQQRLLMFFHWSLTDSKSTQVSRTLRSILANLNNSVVWRMSIHLPICNFSSPLSKPLGTVPNVPFTIGITVTFMLHNFISSLARSKYFSLFYYYNYNRT